MRGALQAGLVGCTIEDATKDKNQPIYPFDVALERISDGIKAARSLDFDFELTGRCKNFLRGKPDLDATIRCPQAYEEARATVLMTPGLPDFGSVRAVCKAASRPFNLMVGIPAEAFAVAELETAGVRRIILATSLY